MNILFLTTGLFDSIEQHGIYTDLLRTFRNSGHQVYSVSSLERRIGRKTEYKEDNGTYALRVKIGNLTKCGIIEKGCSTLLIEHQYKKAIKKYIGQVKFDLVMYSTPPITLEKVIAYIKKRDNAKTYLLLKDIFPQNAVDIGMMKKGGLTGVLYHYFRRKEKQLYAISDRIGCMSPANVDYLLKHNPEIPAAKVEVCPNSFEVRDMSITKEERNRFRERYEIPLDKKVFVYGGNLGKPQGIPFIIECLKTQMSNQDAYFLIVGDGTEYGKLYAFFEKFPSGNMKLMQGLPKEDYDRMVAACDVGLIFLDHRFTIPNFPSRLLSYMQAKLPVLCCTDPNTDVGQVCVDGGFGWWCESNDTAAFDNCVEQALHSDLTQMGEKGYIYLNEHYNVAKAANIIMDGLFIK